MGWNSLEEFLAHLMSMDLPLKVSSVIVTCVSPFASCVSLKESFGRAAPKWL